MTYEALVPYLLQFIFLPFLAAIGWYVRRMVMRMDALDNALSNMREQKVSRDDLRVEVERVSQSMHRHMDTTNQELRDTNRRLDEVIKLLISILRKQDSN